MTENTAQVIHDSSSFLSSSNASRTMMKTNTASFSLRGNQFEKVFRSEVMPLSQNEPIVMFLVH